MSQAVRQSRKAGWAEVHGYPVCLFEALIELNCSDCGALIPPGATFTRAIRAHRTTAPVCRECRPVAPLDPQAARPGYRAAPSALKRAPEQR